MKKQPFRFLLHTLVLSSLQPPVTPPQHDEPHAFGIRVIHPVRIDAQRERLVVPADGDSSPRGDRVLLVEGGVPVGWGGFDRTIAASHVFHLRRFGSERATSEFTTWLIPADVASRTASHWPAGAVLHGSVSTVSPGGRGAWVRFAAGAGVRAGDTLWRRVAGQPIARLDVRFVADERAYCASVPLASQILLRNGDRVAVWPSEGDGGARSAVCFVAAESEGGEVWFAAPRNVDAPDEAHVEIQRRGGFVADGRVVGRDRRFWYALRSSTTSTGEAHVGDDVLIRTRRTIEQRGFSARVFESPSRGFLINAGEADGLRSGERAAVYRDGSTGQAVVIGRVQRDYSTVKLLRGESKPEGLRVGDIVRFQSPQIPPLRVGMIESVAESAWLTVALSDELPRPLFKVLAVSDGTRTVAAAVLIERSGGHAAGFLIEATIDAPIKAGMKLLLRSQRPGP